MTDETSFISHMEQFHKYGYTMVSMILGYDLGLFNRLKDSKVPLTSADLADIAGYKERYVREWLGSMSAASVITVQSSEVQGGPCVYYLSKEHFDIVEACAIFGKGIFACHNRMGILKSCFQKDGPQGDAEAFQGKDWNFFDEYRETTGEKQMMNDFLPKVESLEDFKIQLENGCKVLDLGCGSGVFTMSMAKRYPKSDFVGLDVGDECIHRAKTKCKKKTLSNVRFTKTTLEEFIKDLDEQLDLVTSYQVLHNLPDPIKAIRDIYSSLKPSGKLVLYETGISSNYLRNFGNMSDAINYSFSLFYCLPCSMSDNPYLGYAAGWGEELLLKALDEYFSLDAKYKLGYSTGLYLLSKRKHLL